MACGGFCSDFNICLSQDLREGEKGLVDLADYAL